MTAKTFWRNVANLLRRMPWIVNVGLVVWGLSRARFSAGVIGVVFDDKGQVLLAEHVFHPHTPWGLPGGWIDKHESPADAVQREFREELELVITVDKILLTERGYGEHIDVAYLCSTTGQVGKLSNELLSYRWFNVQELPRIQKFHYRAIMSAVDLMLEERKP